MLKAGIQQSHCHHRHCHNIRSNLLFTLCSICGSAGALSTGRFFGLGLITGPKIVLKSFTWLYPSAECCLKHQDNQSQRKPR